MIHLVCHDVLQCSRFSRFQRGSGLKTADAAIESFKRNMEAFQGYPVTLLCLGEGVNNKDWVNCIKPYLNNWTIQVHGMTHRRYDWCRQETLFNDLIEAKRLLGDTFGVAPTMFYPPFRKFKSAMRLTSEMAGLILDGKHRHPQVCIGKNFKRIDFHYWHKKDVVLTKALVKSREMKLTFILGAPRSGTTAYMRWYQKRCPSSVMLKEAERIWAGDFKKVWFYYANCLLKKGKSHLIDKNVRNTLRLKQISKLFPDAEYIFIYRHPYASISSWRDWAVKTKKRDRTIEGAAKQYVNYVTHWLDNKDGLKDCREKRYEKLCEKLDYFTSRDFKWQKRLTREEKQTVDRIVRPIAGKIGYEL